MIIVVAVVAVIVNAILIFIILAVLDVVTEDDLKEQLRKVHRLLISDVKEQFEDKRFKDLPKRMQKFDDLGEDIKKLLRALNERLERMERIDERLDEHLATVGDLRKDARADRNEWRTESRDLRNAAKEDRENLQRLIAEFAKCAKNE